MLVTGWGYIMEPAGAAAAGCPGRAGAVLSARAAGGPVFAAGTGRPGLGGQELLRHRGVGVLLAGRPGQLLIGDDPGLRVRGHMRPVPVPAGPGGLAGVPRIGVHGRDHPVLRHLLRDPPPPVSALTPGAAGPAAPWSRRPPS